MAAALSPSIAIEAAILDDVPTLARIHAAAFTNDPSIQIRLPDPAQHVEKVIGMLTEQIPDLSWLVMKAVEPNTDSIRGWASWLRSGYQDTEEEEKAPYSVDNSSPALETESSDDLGSYMSAQQKRILGQLMSGKKCLKLNSFFVDPHFQKKGIGTILLKWGSDLADNDHVPCYLASTPSAYHVYCANAFTAREWLDIDLREWGPGGKDGNRGWGNYRLWFMERLPRRAKSP